MADSLAWVEKPQVRVGESGGPCGVCVISVVLVNGTACG